MKSFMNRLFKGALGLALVAGLGTDAFAQTFNSDGAGAKYNATCGGVIRMRSTSGAFNNTNGAVLGTVAATNAIPGVVDWAATLDGQTVQGLYYQRMVISGIGAKSVATGVNIVGDACATFLAGYTNLGTYPFYIDAAAGANTFAGIFTYAGTNQTIYPVYFAGVGQPNNYDSLQVNGTGTVTLASGTNAGASALLTSTGSTLNLNGNLYLGTGISNVSGSLTMNNNAATINVGAGAVNLNGTTTITAGSLIVPDGGPGSFGTVTIGAGPGLTLGSTNAILDFGTSSNLVVTGSLTNAGAGTNLLFDCTSNVTYNGAAGQNVMPTLASNPYGILTLTNGNKVGGVAASYAEDINLCSNFVVNGPNLTMTTNGGTFAMNTATATVTYAGNEEVIGNFARVTSQTVGGPYTFNNARTVVSLTNATNNPSLITLGVIPSASTTIPPTPPNQFVAATDVDRKVNLSYSGNAAAFEMTLRVGYLEGERPNWTAPNTQAALRMYEATGTAVEKIGTGETYARGSATGPTLGYIELAGIGSTASAAFPNNIDVFASGNDVLLRTGPTTFYSIADGRWTNTATWDEGSLPTANDNVELRHMVYAGIAGPFAGTGAAGNTTTEVSQYGTGMIANTITIADISRASFIIGNEDNGIGYTLMTQASGVSFTNNNVNASHQMIAFGTGINANKATYDGTTAFNGLWLTPWGNTGNQLTIFRTNTLQNNNGGTVNVEGILELGN